MCGVFGYVASADGELNLARLEKIAHATESRGRDAWGFAWVDRWGHLHSFKKTGRITSSLALLAMAADARMLIGHCRWTTQGDCRNNVNNHPHPADGGWIVHNGVLPNYRDVIDDYQLAPVTDCDSEILGLLIEYFHGPLARRCAKAVSASSAKSQPLVMLGLWNRPGKLAVVRRGNPLHWTATKGGIYLASLPDELPGKAKAVKDGSVHVFSEKKGCEYYSLPTLAG